MSEEVCPKGVNITDARYKKYNFARINKINVTEVNLNLLISIWYKIRVIDIRSFFIELRGDVKSYSRKVWT